MNKTLNNFLISIGVALLFSAVAYDVFGFTVALVSFFAVQVMVLLAVGNATIEPRRR